MVIQESGDHKAALEHLDTYEEQICDKLSLLETRGIPLIDLTPLSRSVSDLETCMDYFALPGRHC